MQLGHLIIGGEEEGVADFLLTLITLVQEQGGQIAQPVVVRYYHSSRAAVDVLEVIQGKGADAAHGAGQPSLVGRAVGLRAVFHDRQVELAAEVEEGVHVRRQATVVDHKNGLGARRNAASQALHPAPPQQPDSL